MALVRTYPSDRLVVERTAEPWTKKKPMPNEGPTLI